MVYEKPVTASGGKKVSEGVEPSLAESGSALISMNILTNSRTAQMQQSHWILRLVKHIHLVSGLADAAMAMLHNV